MPNSVLIVDDEPKIVELCRDYLAAAGFDVLTAADGPTGLALARREKPNLVVLDLMLPGMDGLDVCRELRRDGNIPIIMLTARVEESDRLVGLELGADDYLTKPFSPRELVARVRTVLRRSSGAAGPSEILRAGDIVLDRSRFKVMLGEREIPVTLTEFEILAALVSQPGRVFSRAQLLTVARGIAFESYERAIDSHIRNLRRKLDAPIEPAADAEDAASAGSAHIVTVHGVGYKFAE